MVLTGKFSTGIGRNKNRYNFAEEGLGPALKSWELGRRISAGKPLGTVRKKKKEIWRECIF